jgi:Na+/proline symporter
VQRYLSGETLAQSRTGLLFNGIIKVPMQFLVLAVGVMMFVFYQFNPSPVHFNSANMVSLQTPQYQPILNDLETKQSQVFETKKGIMQDLVVASRADDKERIEIAKFKLNDLRKEEKAVRDSVKRLVKIVNPRAETKDTDYVFITFVLNNLPVGLIGLLLAVIFSAAMSSESSEINALATTSVIDIYRRLLRPNETDAHYMKTSQWFTAAWGVVAMLFAISASFLDNLIEAVNIVGSLFYGTILGIFMVAFFMKRIGGKAVFYAALIAETIVVTIFTLDKLAIFKFAYLWLNLVGCVLVMVFAWLLQKVLKTGSHSQNAF